jgi:hypothetical protein
VGVVPDTSPHWRATPMGTIAPDWRHSDPTAPSAPTVEIRLRVGRQPWSFTLLITALRAPLTAAPDELRIEM